MLANIHWKVAAIAIVAFAAMLMTGVASATPDPTCVPPDSNDSGLGHCAHTNALVATDASNSPSVDQKWELPDMDSSTGGMQYTDSKEGAEECTYAADGTTKLNTPCINELGNDQPDKNTDAFAHRHHDADPCKFGNPATCQMEVAPNVGDKPEKRMIEVWAVVSDTSGGVGDITTVQAIVTHVPTGEKKDTVPTHPVSMIKRSCDDLGPETAVHSPHHAAVNTGQLEHEKLTLVDCSQLEWNVYSGVFLLNNIQPDGKYEVCVQAIDTAGHTGERCNLFLVQNVVAFKMDFQKVDYGTITPNVEMTVSPGNLENTGNVDACLSVGFSPMEGKDFQQTITTFRAELKGQPLSFDVADSLIGNPQQFPPEANLPPKVPQKIRFTVIPPPGLASDLYQGVVGLAVKKCTDAGSP